MRPSAPATSGPPVTCSHDRRACGRVTHDRLDLDVTGRNHLDHGLRGSRGGLSLSRAGPQGWSLARTSRSRRRTASRGPWRRSQVSGLPPQPRQLPVAGSSWPALVSTRVLCHAAGRPGSGRLRGTRIASAWVIRVPRARRFRGSRGIVPGDPVVIWGQEGQGNKPGYTDPRWWRSRRDDPHRVGEGGHPAVGRPGSAVREPAYDCSLRRGSPRRARAPRGVAACRRRIAHEAPS